jgi:hypothetical protein
MAIYELTSDDIRELKPTSFQSAGEKSERIYNEFSKRILM